MPAPPMPGRGATRPRDVPQPRAAARPNSSPGATAATARSLAHALATNGSVVSRKASTAAPAMASSHTAAVQPSAAPTNPVASPANVSAARAICSFITCGVCESRTAWPGKRRTTWTFQ